jgi:hypothetical protein
MKRELKNTSVRHWWLLGRLRLGGLQFEASLGEMVHETPSPK